MKTKTGLEVYHLETYQSPNGKSYKLGFFIPFKNGVPSTLELWVKAGDKKNIYQAEYSAVWLKKNSDSFRFIDLLLHGLKLEKETALFLCKLWTGVHEIWRTLDDEARKDLPKRSPKRLLRKIMQQTTAWPNLEKSGIPSIGLSQKLKSKPLQT